MVTKRRTAKEPASPATSKAGKAPHRRKEVRTRSEFPIIGIDADIANAALAAIVNSSDDAIIGKSLRGVITSWNQSAERLFGYTAQEAIGHSITILIPPDRLHEEFAILERLKRGERVDHFETIRARKDGSLLDISLTISPIKDATGQVVGASKIARDITERKRTEVLLDAQRSALERLAGGAPLEEVLTFLIAVVQRHSAPGMLAAITLLDKTGTRFERGIGASLPDAFNAALEGVAVDSPIDLSAEAVRRRDAVAAHDFSQDAAWRPFGEFVAPYGLRSAWSVPIIGSNGQLLGTFANYYRTVGDPTPRNLELVDMVVRTAAIAVERKQAEDALRTSEKRFRELADVMPQIVWAARPDGSIDYYNQRWYEYSGFTEGLGQEGFEPILHADDVDRYREAYFGSIRDGAPFQIEYRFKDRFRGGYRWFMGRALPIRSERGEIVRWFGTSTDIDELKQAQDALKDADRRKSVFLALLAHELRAPLAPLSQMLEIVKRAGDDVQLVQQSVATMDRQLGRMTRLVDDLLDMSRIDQGRLTLRRERLELASVIAQVVEGWRPALAGSKQELIVTLPPHRVYLYADALRLAQLFGNLLNNASKYSDPGSRIVLAAEQQGGEIVVSVKDTGIGIPGPMLNRIFDMFMQVDQSLDRAQGGLGIGLALVKQLVEMHGGAVRALSEGPGRGSEFIVRLPVLVEKSEAPSTTPSHTEPSFEGGHRILVVDDNPDTADSLALLLQMTGNETQVARDGLAALDAAAKFRPDVMLLDIGLPKLNGYDVCRRIRAQPWGKDVVLIALTGWGQEEDRQKTAEAGFTGHLVKPVGYADLMKMVAESSTRVP